MIKIAMIIVLLVGPTESVMAALALGRASGGSANVTVQLDFLTGGKHAPWFVAVDKGFYAKRGLNVTLQPGKGSSTTVRAIADGSADFGFADIATAIVAQSRGAPVQAVAQLGYVAATILWRSDGNIKTVRDLNGKSWAISPGQAHWYLMPAYCRINHINFRSIRIQNTPPAEQPLALVNKLVDFIIQVRASNDEVAEQVAKRASVDIERVFMKDTGLDIYGSGLIVRQEDVKKRPQLVRAYVEGTMEGLRYTRDHQEESLRILLKRNPLLEEALTSAQLKNAMTEVMLPPESSSIGLGYMKPEIMQKTVRVTNEYFDVARRVGIEEIFNNQFIKR